MLAPSSPVGRPAVVAGVAARAENGPVLAGTQVERVQQRVAGRTAGTAGVVTIASNLNLLGIKHGKPTPGAAGLAGAGPDGVGLVSLLVLHHQGPGTKVLAVAGQAENLADSRIRGRGVVQGPPAVKTRETFLRGGVGVKVK